ncbi:MAG: hypothetical protein ACLTBV_27180 [Enterocloster bolteae]
MAALGLLSADIEHEEVVTFAAKIDEVDLQELGKQLLERESSSADRKGPMSAYQKIC